MSDRDSERFYANPWDPSGDPFPSVTTILQRVAAKPDLMAWRSREAARHAVEHWDEVSDLVCAERADEAIAWAAGEPDRIAGRAADLGKLIHRLTEAEIKGEPVTMTEEESKSARPYMDSFHRFLDEMQPTYRWAEATVYHQWQNYAGTTDGGVEFARPVPVVTPRGELVEMFEPGMLLNEDTKTGKRVWPDVVPQQVAYSTATHMGIRDALGTLIPMPRVHGAVVVHLGPWGYRVHGVRITPQARAAWEHAVGWYRWLRGQCEGDLGIGLRPSGESLLLEDLPGIDVRIRNRLALNGKTTLADLEEMGEAAFLGIKHAGPKAVETARRLLALEGRGWAELETERGAA